jgi:ABC-type phosphate/phosphonate transport system substrate-binding protein
MKRGRIGLGLLLVVCGASLAAAAPASEGGRGAADPVKIGLVKSLFRDIPAPLVQMLSYPFSALMRAQTGLNGELVTVKDWDELGRQLHDAKVQLGVFHGIEFAWARQKHQDLRPLCIAINKRRHLQAFVLVRADSPARQVADLKGKVLALPVGTREHCRVFLDGQCAACGLPRAQFFSRVITPANVEVALDDVVRGKTQAAVIDEVSLDCYQQVKPGCFARLKVLQRSRVFPAGVIVYRQGALDRDTLDRFKTGMTTANQNERGRELMTMWKLTAFETVPADYEQTLADILRAYPPPGITATISTSHTDSPARP